MTQEKHLGTLKPVSRKNVFLITATCPVYTFPACFSSSLKSELDSEYFCRKFPLTSLKKLMFDSPARLLARLPIYPRIYSSHPSIV